MDILEAFPVLKRATLLKKDVKRIYIGAYGFEQRSLGWCRSQKSMLSPLSKAILFQYVHPKGKNMVEPLRRNLRALGAKNLSEIQFDYDAPHMIESRLEKAFLKLSAEEIILDTSAMAKVLILAALCKLKHFKGTLRIVYSEALDYCPNRKQYETLKGKLAATARFPSRGCDDIVRLRCLSSIRMQGQPLSLVAFTSFNEKLVSHMLGHMSPHRLLLINGRPPRRDYKWRELATQDIHRKYWLEYANDNPLDGFGRLTRSTSTLDYRETVAAIEKIYKDHGLLER